ncbi:MAG: AEC family transporter [Brevinemataceae bacterium]
MNLNILNTLVSTFLLILLGTYLRWSEFMSKRDYEFLTRYLFNLILPCFILSSFMQDVSDSLMSSGFNIFLWGIIIHSVLLILGHLYFNNNTKYTEDERTVLKNILPIGSISFFGVALVSSLYGNEGIFTSNMMTLSVRIFLYSICFISISGLSFQKKHALKIIKTPSLICSFIGLIIFFFQNITPQIAIDNQMVSILRIDQTLPMIFKPIKMIGSGLNATIWIIIGASITKSDLFSILHSKKSLVFMFQKIIIIPLISIFIYWSLESLNILKIDKDFLPSLFMLTVSPAANTLILFAIQYNKAAALSIACLLTSTIGAFIVLPFYDIFFRYIIERLF